MKSKKPTKEVVKNKNTKGSEAYFEEDPQKESNESGSTLPLPEEALEIMATFKKKGKKNG